MIKVEIEKVAHRTRYPAQTAAIHIHDFISLSKEYTFTICEIIAISKIKKRAVENKNSFPHGIMHCKLTCILFRGM